MRLPILYTMSWPERQLVSSGQRAGAARSRLRLDARPPLNPAAGERRHVASPRLCEDGQLDVPGAGPEEVPVH